ncbi:MAG: hypothetical protein M1816_000678 [Peltula sp. TS41687]|nr:MAG: hypothetical protein M1816_000678 [Peltula sp. TS41687]
MSRWNIHHPQLFPFPFHFLLPSPNPPPPHPPPPYPIPLDPNDPLNNHPLRLQRRPKRHDISSAHSARRPRDGRVIHPGPDAVFASRGTVVRRQARRHAGPVDRHQLPDVRGAEHVEGQPEEGPQRGAAQGGEGEWAATSRRRRRRGLGVRERWAPLGAVVEEAMWEESAGAAEAPVD